MKRPTFPAFVLRSRAFWLAILTQAFFSWAWWDSTIYRNQLFYNMTGKSGIYIASQESGVSVGKVDFTPIARFVFFTVRDEQYQSKGKLSLITFSPFYIHYLTLLVFSFLVHIAWQTWQWHRLKKAYCSEMCL
jgi:hypothetical protein